MDDACGNGGWNEFVCWANRIYAWAEWESVERATKLALADCMGRARCAVLDRADDWHAQLRRAVGTPNHVTNWHMQTQFLGWVAAHHTDTLRALDALWAGAGPVESRINGFASVVPSQVVADNPVPMASFLLMGDDPTVYAVSRPQPFELAYKLTRFQPCHSARSAGDKYLERLEFLDTFRTHAATAGCDVRDRLDAQGLVWSVTRWNVDSVPMSDWPAPDRERLLNWRTSTQAVHCCGHADEIV